MDYKTQQKPQGHIIYYKFLRAVNFKDFGMH